MNQIRIDYNEIFLVVCDPDVPVNGAIVMTIASAIPERYVIGSLIEFQCNDGFTRTGGFEVGLCQANNDIQGGRPICVRKFFPLHINQLSLLM